MNVTGLTLAGQDGRSDLAFERLAPQVNVLYGPPRSGKSAVAQLLGHLLYGKTHVGDRSAGATKPAAAGSLSIASRNGQYILRRHRDESPLGRLTVAAADRSAIDGRSIQRLLGNAPPRLLARLYAVDFAAGTRVEDLFSAAFARDFNAHLAAIQQPDANGHAPEDRPAESSGRRSRRTSDGGSESINKQLDALIARRDELALQLEGQLSDRRHESGDLQRQSAELQRSLRSSREQREDLLAELQRLQAEHAGLGTRLRYYALESTACRTAPGDREKQQLELETLDAEIGRCRQTLANLQQREGTLRRELAEAHPDGAAHSEDSLADQRATLGVIERLLGDLDAETAQLARTIDTARRPGAEAHARISPVADMLRQQVYALCGQIAEQERAVRRQRLKAEARQVSRAQADLAEQLEQLLDSRQGLLHRQRLERQRVVQYPLGPIDGHCQCEHHGRFVVESDAMLLGRGDRVAREETARRDAAELAARIAQAEAELDAAEQTLAAEQRAWEQLQRRRAELLGPEAIDRMRDELQRLEAEIGRLLGCGCEHLRHESPAGWRASDVLAQLTDGRLVQIRTQRGGAGAVGEVIDRDGRRRSFSELTPAERDQAYLAVTLALAATHADSGERLPLVLDEPFLRQTPADAAAMAGVLASFAARGQQVIVATADQYAMQRFEGLGVEIFRLDALQAERPRVAPIAAPQVEPETRTSIRLVRTTTDGPAPALRVAGAWPNNDGDRPVYYLTEDASIADFPVLGNNTAARFHAVGVRTTGELLAADPERIASSLALPSVTAAVVRLWQTHMRLMCFVPDVSLNDAQVLGACGVTTPDELAGVDVDDLIATVDAFLATERGRRFASASDRFSRDQLRSWRRAAERRSERWRRSSAFASWQRNLRDEGVATVTPIVKPHRPAPTPKPSVKDARNRSARKSRAAASPSQRAQRYYLELESPVVDAPAIGEKMSQALAGVGIRTVADLLACDPGSVAEELGERRVTFERIRDWQAQARLVCRIPELRGVAAQLLVACGYAAPEQIAGANAGELAERIGTFCRTTDGQRILRNSPVPTVAKVAQWIVNAGRTRTLGAA
ncbi:MAG: DUF4332 domain-containing protein [Pirellulales bacterium]|nr:DUF4332 domain-containing protein [Pirellulales bacterium]